MVYEDICNFGMDQLVITQYKKILKKCLTKFKKYGNISKS